MGKPAPYRLALRLGLVEAPDGQTPEHKVSLAWAVVKLGHMQASGTGPIPAGLLAGSEVDVVRVASYARSADMLEPIPLDEYEHRLRAVLRTLPGECLLVRVPYDASAYAAWLQGRDDTSQARAEWANQLDLE